MFNETLPVIFKQCDYVCFKDALHTQTFGFEKMIAEHGLRVVFKILIGIAHQLASCPISLLSTLANQQHYNLSSKPRAEDSKK